jgi:4-hydroxybenzoate polyprenyltransferase
MMFILLANVGYLSGGGRVYYAILALGILIVTRQLYFLNPTNPAQCQKIFASPYLGWLVWGALLALSM